jgi:Reverse transcriptase (RNA-dependent DNA polymerase)
MSESKPAGKPGKPFVIDKNLVMEAYRRVAANKGAPGVDEVSIAEFERDLKGNLYKIWNRLSSGTYFPPPVRAVEISKAHGSGVRVLGVPTVGDRVAQTVARLVLEPMVEPVFHPDSYGYRPGRSAHDALAVCRQRCFADDWVLDLDIRAFFDSVPHDRVLAAVDHHLKGHPGLRWISLYVGRWLTAPIQQLDGMLVSRDRGTPQGSAMTPPTQWATSPSRCRCRIASWNGLGVSPTGRDMSGSMFMTWLVVVLVASSSRSGSTRPPSWLPRARLRGRRPARWRRGLASPSVRPAGMWTGPCGPGVPRCLRRRWCSPSSSRWGWRRGCGYTPRPRVAPSPPWSRRLLRSSWRVPVESVRTGERPGGRDPVRLRPPGWGGIVGGLQHSRPRTAGPDRAGRRGSEVVS